MICICQQKKKLKKVFHYVHPLTADTGENKASVRTEDFTEYPIWHKLWKAAGKSSVRKRQRHLMFLPSAVPLHDKT